MQVFLKTANNFPQRSLPALQNVNQPTSSRRHTTAGLKAWSFLMQQSPTTIDITLATTTTNNQSSGVLTALLTAVDCEHGTIHVRELTSPIGNYSAALVRMNDIDRLECNVDSTCFDRLLNHAMQQKDTTNWQKTKSSPDEEGELAISATKEQSLPFARDAEVSKYWSQRYHLFSKFDSIQTDKVGLYSATPECVAQHVASQVQNKKNKVVWDAFAGIGGNCCHFATFARVIASDLNGSRLQMCQHNCKIVYGVERIEFIVGDCLDLCKTLRADVVVLSPPWGGPQYLEQGAQIALDQIISVPCSGVQLLREALVSVLPGGVVVYMLPKNVDKRSLVEAGKQLGSGTSSVKIEDIHVNGVLKMTILYYYTHAE